MITLIIKSYLYILISISIGTLLFFMLGLYLIFRKSKREHKCALNPAKVRSDVQVLGDKHRQHLTSSPPNVVDIAGDDLISTQLDLARAYIETGKNLLAKTILEPIVVQGNTSQRQEAERLLSLL